MDDELMRWEDDGGRAGGDEPEFAPSPLRECYIWWYLMRQCREFIERLCR